MITIDERRLSQSTIETIGHNCGISDTGCDFDEFCKENDMSVSQLIRKAIKEYMDKEK